MKIVKALSIVPVLVFVLSGCLATTDANDKVVLKNQGPENTVVDKSTSNCALAFKSGEIKYASADCKYSTALGYQPVTKPDASAKFNKAWDGAYVVDIQCEWGSINDGSGPWTIKDGQLLFKSGRWNVAGEVYGDRLVFDGQRQSGNNLGWYALSGSVKFEGTDVIKATGNSKWKGNYCTVIFYGLKY